MRMQEDTEEDSPPSVSHSPSFSTFSAETIAQIAARVIGEFHKESNEDHINGLFLPWETHDQDLEIEQSHHENVEEDDDFEFAFVSGESGQYSSPISADEIFCNGQIRPIYPIFDHTLLSGHDSYRNDSVQLHVDPVSNANETTPQRRRRRPPLRELMFEDREMASSSSSSSISEADDNELEGVNPESYCVWNPGQSCRKSSSTGSASKRWKLRDLLSRSHSDGKESPLLLTPLKKTSGGETGKDTEEDVSASKARKKSCSSDEGKAAREGGNSIGDGSWRRSFLPYRQEMIGIFNNNVNGLGRNLRPF